MKRILGRIELPKNCDWPRYLSVSLLFPDNASIETAKAIVFRQLEDSAKNWGKAVLEQVRFTIREHPESIDLFEPNHNIHLLAAAPDLLAACKLALNAFERRDAIDWNILADAIAKAEGREP